MKRSLFLLVLCLSAVSLFSGCSLFDSSYRYVQPTVAVFKFENKAPLPMKWQLGEGMADMLISRLMDTKRFTVLERQDIDTVLSELNLQKSGYTRQEGRVAPKRLKNVKYLVKGVITDFAHVAGGGIGIGYRWLRIGGGGKIALVSMVVTVIEVESGQVLMSETVRGYTYCGSLDTKGIYQNVAFGGQVFFNLPLGHATSKAMKKAVKRIVAAVGEQRWRPVVLTVGAGRIVVNGGDDRHLKTGDLYYVLRPTDPVYDSQTGDLLGQAPGREIGVLQITDVFPKFAYARLMEGAAGKEGYSLRLLTSPERTALLDRAQRMAQPQEMAPPLPIN